MSNELCPRCQKLQPNVGPWNGEGGGWRRLCGGCKIAITLATSGVKENLATSIKGAGAAMGINVGSVEFVDARNKERN